MLIIFFVKTEGVKYAGSKKSLLPVILRLIEPLQVRTIFDGFTGTARVAQAFKRAGYAVTANDVAVWSRVFATCYLLNRQTAVHYEPMIEHLNTLPGRRGWFSEHYGGEANGGCSIQSDGKKRIWQLHNTMKLDAIRDEIDHVAQDEIEKSVLLTSLMLALDKTDSTLGHQVSYLRHWARRAYGELRLRVPALIVDDQSHRVFQGDVFSLLDSVETDLAYYDPPYGSANERMPPSRVRYASYYHLWKTVCLNDRPEVCGAANRRADASDRLSASVFEEFRKSSANRYRAVEAIERLLKSTRARYTLLSYSSGGRGTYQEIVEVIAGLRRQSLVIQLDYRQNVMANMIWTKEWAASNHPDDHRHQEFFFLIGDEIPDELMKQQRLNSQTAVHRSLIV
jgi:adenine-specific DNA-methyltransferase